MYEAEKEIGPGPKFRPAIKVSLRWMTAGMLGGAISPFDRVVFGTAFGDAVRDWDERYRSRPAVINLTTRLDVMLTMLEASGEQRMLKEAMDRANEAYFQPHFQMSLVDFRRLSYPRDHTEAVFQYASRTTCRMECFSLYVNHGHPDDKLAELVTMASWFGAEGEPNDFHNKGRMGFTVFYLIEEYKARWSGFGDNREYVNHLLRAFAGPFPGAEIFHEAMHQGFVLRVPSHIGQPDLAVEF